MPELKDYSIIFGYEVEASDIQVSTLNIKLSSLFRDTTENMNSTPDITCQTVWYEKIDENSTLKHMEFEELLLVGFNGIGSAEFNEVGIPHMNTYSVPIVLLESTIETMEHEIDNTLEENIEDVERVILAPREHGVSF